MTVSPGAHDPGVLDPLAVVMARRLDDRIPEIADVMTDRLAGIEEISPDPQMRVLLRASIEANLATIMHMVENGIPLEQVGLPMAAAAYAERLAQRGVSANSLVRAYHMGLDDLKEHLFEEVDLLDESPELKLRLVQHLFDGFYRYIDKATLQVLDIHQAEQLRWSAAAGNVVSAVVHRLLSGDPPPERLLAETGLVLDQRHVGLILWSESEGADADPDRLRALESAGRAVAAALGANDPLFCAADLVTAWLWIPRGRRGTPIPTSVVADALERVPGGRAAIGLPAAGLAGFRRTHRQALAARGLALAGADRIVAYGDPGVALVAMLARDLPDLQEWVPDVLGGLAADTEPNARLRETVLAFLECGASPKATAERLHLHRNTVRYRLERAVELLGHDLDQARPDLEVALRCVERLGRRVLAGAGEVRAER